MIKRVSIIAAVALAAGLVLWLKSASTKKNGPNLVTTAQKTTVEKRDQPVSVILFADPRETEAECGCADIIRLARETKDWQGVQFREVDSRHTSKLSNEYKVLVSPTVIVLDGKSAPQRFEGEAKSTIDQLESVLKTLMPSSTRPTPHPAS